ncbi:BgTH12-01987 [Blumeria graminis f. sp. triticale]|nr:BgTH12-01987 [Blumeria graminis f. sp. triticale]
MVNLQSEKHIDEPAFKRQKISQATAKDIKPQCNDYCLYELIEALQSKDSEPSRIKTQSDREAVVGIHHYVNPSRIGFSGLLKKRYTDFIVNEIALDGTVHHLTDIKTFVPEDPISKGNETESISVQLKPQQSNSFPEHHPLSGSGESKQTETTTSNIANVSETQTSGVSVEQPSYTDEDLSHLNELVGSETTDEILKLDQRILAKPGAKAKVVGHVLTPPITDRQIRSKLHQSLRRIFQSRFESSFDGESKGIRIIPASKSNRCNPDKRRENRDSEKQLKGKIGWEERGGEYLHFTLFKQDRDTMEVISQIARFLKVKPNVFSYAGTKDRRAVTTQRVSSYRLTPKALSKVNNNVYNISVGNFKYEKQPLELGELKGNRFTISLREVRIDGYNEKDIVELHKKVRQIVGAACNSVASSGFINYYGLQRFGTFEIGTHIIGRLILQGNFPQAVSSILHCSSDSWNQAIQGSGDSNDGKSLGKDELNRAKSIKGFIRGEIKLEETLNNLPRRFTAERNILQHLKDRKSRDFLGALLSVPRNLRLMYVHAYQSYIWNLVASERWARYGSQVVAGDLVLVDLPKNNPSNEAKYDESGEIIVRPAAHDICLTRDAIYERARPLSSDDISTQKYNIFDIVLPLPGFDVEYPANDIGDYYKTLMGSEEGGGLDPADMRRKQKDFSLSGSYRKLLAHVNYIQFSSKIYHDGNEQLAATDMDKLSERCKDDKNLEVKKLSCPTQEHTTPDGARIKLSRTSFNPSSCSMLESSDKVGALSSDQTTLTSQDTPTISPHSESKKLVEAPQNDLLASSNMTAEYLAAELAPRATVEGTNLGIILEFDLSSSQYATMLLREIMGSDNVHHFQPDFGPNKKL